MKNNNLLVLVGGAAVIIGLFFFVGNSAQKATLVPTSALEAEYIVDASDIVSGTALLEGIEKSVLSEKEIAGLVQMREEEKLAHDVYATLGTQSGVNTFANIASSEQTHTDAIKVLLDRYGIADPVAKNGVGVFTSKEMQKLYDELVAKGTKSTIDALIVGATIEDLDIFDLDTLKKETTKQDILVTYNNLQKGSRNHMRAFTRNINAKGGTYTAQYITGDAYQLIIASPQERGRI